MNKEMKEKIINAVENNNTVLCESKEYGNCEVLGLIYDDNDNGMGLIISYEDEYSHEFLEEKLTWEDLDNMDFKLYVKKVELKEVV